MMQAKEFDSKKIAAHIQTFVLDCMQKAGSESLVIGLSGGIDSAVTAILCRQFLRKDQVKCIFLPERATPHIDRDHTELLVQNFDLHYQEKDITELVAVLKEVAITPPDKVALGNVKARLRMVLLYEYANMTGSLVCGTSNKSELMVGYFTKHGDGGVDLMPIGRLYKAQVRVLAEFLELPRAIIDKPPSAGLFEGQTDEGELKMTYRMLDRILNGLEQHRADADIAKSTGTALADVVRIRTLVNRNAHKHQVPPRPPELPAEADFQI